jgi:hypothetical protein
LPPAFSIAAVADLAGPGALDRIGALNALAAAAEQLDAIECPAQQAGGDQGLATVIGASVLTLPSSMPHCSTSELTSW